MTYRISPTTGRLIGASPEFAADKPVTVDAIGTSIFAVRLNGLSPDCEFKFANGLSEDLYFCSKVREYYKDEKRIYVDGRVRTAHMKRPEPIRWPG